jgi:hypothetical protein
MVLSNEQSDVYARMVALLESMTSVAKHCSHTHLASGLPSPDRRPKVEAKYMVTAFDRAAWRVPVKSAIVGTKEEAFRFVGEWLEQGYVVRVEQ